LAEYTFGIQSIIDTDILRILVDKLVEEKEEEILVLIMKLINILLEGEMATDLVLSTPVLARLNGYLKAKNWQIRKLSAENLGSISYHVMGKIATIDAGSIQPLSEMLGDEIFEVRAAAIRALASLAQLKEGKI
jgi:HEAT repeat protein